MKSLFFPTTTTITHQGLKGLLKDLQGGYGILAKDDDLYDLLSKDSTGTVHVVLTDEGPVKEFRIVSTFGLCGGVITMSNGLNSLFVVDGLKAALKDYGSENQLRLEQGKYIFDKLDSTEHLHGVRSTLDQFMTMAGVTNARIRSGSIEFECLDKYNRQLTIVLTRKYGKTLARVYQGDAGVVFAKYEKFSKWCKQHIVPAALPKLNIELGFSETSVSDN